MVCELWHIGYSSSLLLCLGLGLLGSLGFLGVEGLLLYCLASHVLLMIEDVENALVLINHGRDLRHVLQ